MKKLIDYLLKLKEEKFYGLVHLEFRNGILVSIKLEKSLNPTEFRNGDEK